VKPHSLLLDPAKSGAWGFRWKCHQRKERDKDFLIREKEDKSSTHLSNFHTKHRN
jgi:hypothetical protein